MSSGFSQTQEVDHRLNLSYWMLISIRFSAWENEVVAWEYLRIGSTAFPPTDYFSRFSCYIITTTRGSITALLKERDNSSFSYYWNNYQSKEFFFEKSAQQRQKCSNKCIQTTNESVFKPHTNMIITLELNACRSELTESLAVCKYCIYVCICEFQNRKRLF